jgi:hypothetical protein
LPCGGPVFCGGALVVPTWVVHTFVVHTCVVRTCRVEAGGGFLAGRSHAGPSNAGPAAPAGSRRSWGAGRGGSPRRRALTRLPRGASGELRHTRPPLRRPPRPAPRTLASRRVGKKVDERGSEPLERRVPVVASVGREGRAREGARGSFFPGRGFRIVLARGGGGRQQADGKDWDFSSILVARFAPERAGSLADESPDCGVPCAPCTGGFVGKSQKQPTSHFAKSVRSLVRCEAGWRGALGA